VDEAEFRDQDLVEPPRQEVSSRLSPADLEYGMQIREHVGHPAA
jgi:hypothetical protein